MYCMLFLAVSISLLPRELDGATLSLGLGLPYCTMGYVEETLRVAGLVTLALGCGRSWAQLMAG